jgi:hypothetical protein
MLSNTGGDNANNSSSGAVVVGEGKSAAEAKVYVSFAVSEVVPANCAGVAENTVAAEVGTTDESISLEGGDNANNSSHGAVVVGDGKCAAEAEVSVGFAVSEVVPAEVQGGVDEAQRGREQKDGGGIGSRGRGGVLGVGDNNGWGLNDRAADASRCASERGVRSRNPSPSTTTTTTQQSNSSREREGRGRWYVFHFVEKHIAP